MFNLSEQRLFLLPNPSRFSINDVNFAVTGVDTLYHIKKEEYIKRGAEIDPIPPFPGDPGNDPMANLCRHLLQQRRYVPQYSFYVKVIQDETQFLSFISSPNRCITRSESECNTPRWPPNGRRCTGRIDYPEQAQTLLEGQSIMLFLIRPKKSEAPIQTVHSTVALNPGFLAKGTYAVVNVAAAPAQGVLMERMSTEIVKLEV